MRLPDPVLLTKPITIEICVHQAHLFQLGTLITYDLYTNRVCDLCRMYYHKVQLELDRIKRNQELRRAKRKVHFKMVDVKSCTNCEYFTDSVCEKLSNQYIGKGNSVCDLWEEAA